MRGGDAVPWAKMTLVIGYVSAGIESVSELWIWAVRFKEALDRDSGLSEADMAV
jgi:hypothetical protein